MVILYVLQRFLALNYTPVSISSNWSVFLFAGPPPVLNLSPWAFYTLFGLFLYSSITPVLSNYCNVNP